MHASVSAVVTTLLLAVVAEEVGSSTDRLQMPEDQDGGCNSDANAASASVVTSLGEISLWLNGVMDDEWWVCPAGANAQPSRLLYPERETGRCGRLLYAPR